MRLDIDVTEGKKQGSQTYLGAIKDADKVRSILKEASEKAKVASPKTYEPIPDAVETSVNEEDQYDRELAELDSSIKAAAYQEIFKSLGEQYNYSGSWSSGSMEMYLLTTSNINEAYHRSTDQLFSIVLKHPEYKWELTHNQTGWKTSDFSVENTINALTDLISVFEENEGFKPEPGEYTVVFGASAVSEIIQMAVYTGLTGRGWEEKQSWTSGFEIGDRILGENVSIVDDPTNPKTYICGFDACGRRRKIFPLVGNGDLLNFMYDSASAAKYGKEPTGHDTGSTSIVMDTGFGHADFLEEIKDMGRVLYIPALHYLNIPNRSKGLFTGSSRFNAVLVENGRIVSPIFSSRVTDSFQSVLGNVKVISSVSESVNNSNTYGRRTPLAMSVPSYIISTDVKITDSADSF